MHYQFFIYIRMARIKLHYNNSTYLIAKFICTQIFFLFINE